MLKGLENLLRTHRADGGVCFPLGQDDAETLLIKLQAVLVFTDDGLFCKAVDRWMLHHAAPRCPVFSANLTLKGFIHLGEIQVKSCYQPLDITLPPGFLLLDSSPPV